MMKAYILKTESIKIPGLEIEENNLKCPKCGRRLYYRNDGLVCKNWRCPLYWKYGNGVVFSSKKPEDTGYEIPLMKLLGLIK